MLVLAIALLALTLSVILTVYRVMIGPSWGDRITAFDFLTSNLAVLIVIVSLQTGFADLLDAALIISILGFLSTVALTRYLLTRRVI